MANFHKYRDKAIRAVDRMMAERIQLLFLAEGRSDASRENTEIQAVLRAGAGSDEKPGGMRSSWHSEIASGRAELHISRAAYAGPPIRTKDKIRALERDGRPFFEVLRVDDRTHGRLILELGEA